MNLGVPTVSSVSLQPPGPEKVAKVDSKAKENNLNRKFDIYRKYPLIRTFNRPYNNIYAQSHTFGKGLRLGGLGSDVSGSGGRGFKRTTRPDFPRQIYIRQRHTGFSIRLIPKIFLLKERSHILAIASFSNIILLTEQYCINFFFHRFEFYSFMASAHKLVHILRNRCRMCRIFCLSPRYQRHLLDFRYAHR